MWRSSCLLRSAFVYDSCVGMQSTKKNIALQQMRGFGRKRTTNIQRRNPDVVVDPDISHFINYGHLVKPFLFTVAVTGISFTTAAIWQYESLRRLTRLNVRHFTGTNNFGFYRKAGNFRDRLNAWWNNLHPGQKVISGIIAVNMAVFLAWRVPVLAGTMAKYFLSSPASEARCWSMLLSTFSHSNSIHLFLNMYVLWSFGPVVSSQIGKEQFMAIYLSSGVISSFAGYVYKVAMGRMVPSLGASGAIMTLIGFVGTTYPDARFSIALVNEVFPHSFSANTGLKTLIAVDFVGVIFGWGLFDHAAHLGGMLFGICYAKYGSRYARKYRDAVARYWHKLRGKP